MDPTIIAWVLLFLAILVVIFFLWKTQRREPALPAEEGEGFERPVDRVIRCPNCETQVDWDTAECPECQTQFEEEVFVCPSCKSSAEPAALECEKCGLAFMEEAFVCPNCKRAVEPEATRCDRCKETFWSPMKLPTGKGMADMLKAVKEGEAQKEGEKEDGKE